MLFQLAWPRLELDSTLLIQRVINNTHALSNQHGYSAKNRYAGLWHWPEQSQDADHIYTQLGLSLPHQRLHCQWIKPPGVWFHCDRNRHFSAVCTLTDPHPTSFRIGDQVHEFTMQPLHWYLFDHTVEHAVLNLRESRYAVAIDFTGLYTNFTDLCTAATAGSLRSS